MENHMLTHASVQVCLICGEFFPSSYRYLRHLKSHTKDDPTSCPLCNVRTITSDKLTEHLNVVHLQNYPYYCTQCDKGFFQRLVFQDHQDFHKWGKRFECVVCGSKYSSLRSLISHQVAYHTACTAEVTKMDCAMCQKRFATAEGLQKHMRLKHKEERPHLCDNCGKCFTTKTKLRLHYRIHTGEKPFACDYCQKSFSKKEYLVMHVRVHTGEKPYTCEYCGKSFSQPSTLRIHVRSHTGEKPYVCQICSATFPVRASLTAHYKSCTRE